MFYVGGYSEKLEGEVERLYVIDRVATDWRAAGSNERNCEPSAVHITWVDSWEEFNDSLTGCNS